MQSFANREISWSAVTKTTPLTSEIVDHLKKVYSLLTLTVATAAIGAFFVLKTGYHGNFVTFIGQIALIFWLSMTPQEDVRKRVSILAGFGFFTGLNIGPLCALALDVNPQALLTAFFGTVVVFGCFSASAIFAERRSQLYLGSFLGSALSLLVVLNLINFFARTSFLFNVSLYGGLMVFSLFIMFDTQLMIEKVHAGRKDYVSDALELFLDFVNVFVRILVILLKNGSKKDKK